MIRHIRLLILCLVPFMAACSAQRPLTLESYTPSGANPPESAFTTNLSAIFGTDVDGVPQTRRVTGLMWGNGTGPVRLDISAGIGAVIARCLENDTHMLIHIPEEGNLYATERGGDTGLRIFNFRLPFDLHETVLISHGCFTPLTDGTHAGRLTLAQNGLPGRWSGKDGWTVEFAYRDGVRPYKIKARHTDGSEALIIIKRLESVRPYTQEQLQLNIPAGTVTR